MNDDQVNCEALTSTGTATLATTNISGVATLSSHVFINGDLVGGQSATAVATITGGTIATGFNNRVSRVNPAGAITGVIMQAGTQPGQEITVVNEAAAANTVTMAVAGTSNVADGVSTVIAGLTANRFTWDSVTALWYHNK